MKKVATLVLATLLIAGCTKKENKIISKTVENTTSKIKEVVAVGKVEPQNDIINLAAMCGGIVVKVLKTDGDTVKTGDVLIKLDDEIDQLKISQIKSQVQTQKSQIEIEQNTLKNASIKLSNKKQLLSSTKNLLKSGAETQQVFDDLNTEVNTLENDVERAKIAVQSDQSRLNELTFQLKQAQVQAAEKTFRAPFSGTVLNMMLTKGEAVNQYAKYAEFAPMGNKFVRAEVDEMFCQDLKPGQKVDIRYPGTDKIIATGTINKLSPYLKKKSLFSENASDQEDRRVREIKVLLNDDPNILINSKVECVIKL